MVTRRFNLEEFDLFKDLLHSVGLMLTELEYVCHSTLFNDTRYDLVTLTELYDFFLTLVVEDRDYFIQWKRYVIHALFELIFNLIEPFEHADEPWLRSNEIDGF